MNKFWRRALAKVCLLGLVLAGAGAWRSLSWVRTWSYSAAVALAKEHTEWQTRDWLAAESRHFRLKYRSQDASVVPLVLETAEEAYNAATQIFGYRPPDKTLVLLYPDRQSLARQFGWAADESAMGVYWAGAVRILSPLDWPGPGRDLAAVFKAEGPLLHEFVHLLVDQLARGNYPRWLTEGIAQYVEEQVTGYRLPGPEAAETSTWYTLEDLDRHFDNLPDQALAYRQSLLMVDYLRTQVSWEGIRQLLLELGRGTPFNKALERATGLDVEELPAPLFTPSR
ncbi:MAG: hypothetical protein IMW96_12725 [Thermoanaerobacteraceae bacterium]|nr:hypothetical protein [Thermoanaerobacteraceae bacterium]